MEATFICYTGLDKALKYALGPYCEIASYIGDKAFQNV